jgi:hypothetical protein
MVGARNDYFFRKRTHIKVLPSTHIRRLSKRIHEAAEHKLDESVECAEYHTQIYKLTPTALSLFVVRIIHGVGSICNITNVVLMLIVEIKEPPTIFTCQMRLIYAQRKEKTAALGYIQYTKSSPSESRSIIAGYNNK